MSAVGPDFPMDMTWERLILLSLIKKRPKNIFPETRCAGYWWFSQCTVVPAAFYQSIFLTPCIISNIILTKLQKSIISDFNLKTELHELRTHIILVSSCHSIALLLPNQWGFWVMHLFVYFPVVIMVMHCIFEDGLQYLVDMSHCQMLGKVEYGLPAKIWRLVGSTEMLSW